ncbi:MAG: choice-of-anchor L domain-containing protein [Planctomycetota bacterium]|nr:choice-of-anchor L domain-containing protein [Planctomycetota bacterium]MDA1250409.1 choice-of-anchor L domain-containing protein [Planctomycetota bacterium]
MTHQVDTLEERALLSASAVLLGSELRILTNADESIAFQLNANDPTQAEILINGEVFEGAPTLLVTSFSSLLIEAGELDNTINLATLSVATYTNLTSIRVFSGDGHDTITASPDIPTEITAGDGHDTITGGGANDTIFGEDGDDVILGGDGDDSIDAGDGEDVVSGEGGNDEIQGDDGNDTISGGDGDDTIFGHDGADSLDGDAGLDVIFGDLGDDVVNGGDDNDRIFGGAGADILDGGNGDDVINGQGGPDLIMGSAGNDFLYGSGGPDTILGGDGNDFSRGDAGMDMLIGGAGDDVQLGGSANDFIVGEAGADHSFGNAGDDTILGGDGADTLDGGTGNDLIDNSLLFRPPITVNNVQLNEGSGGVQTDFVFSLSLPAPALAPVMVDFATVDDTAIAGEDYVARSGKAVFDIGVQTVTVTVPVIGDDVIESTEAFFLEISNPVGGSLNNTMGVGQIVNDDGIIAPGLNVTATIDPGVLTTTVVGSSGGITVNNMNLSANMGFQGELSGGTFTAGTGAPYGLTGGGIILSTGDVADYASGPDTTSQTTSFGVQATPAQELLLDPITGGMFDHNDVTQLDIDFDLQPGFDTLFFELVFGSEEFPVLVGSSFIDGFAIYLNGTNIANFNGSPVNIDHPDFAAISGTELNGVLAPNGMPKLTFSALLSDGQTGNTITFIIADTTDTSLDSTVYIASLGGTPPGTTVVPPPPTLPLVETVPTTIVGGTGDDTIFGGGSDDFVDGGTGNDTISTFAGNDTVFGGGGNDTVDGGAGQDLLVGNGGSDFLDGGAGADTFLWREKDFRVTVAGGDGNDNVIVQGGRSGGIYSVDSVGSDLTVSLGNSLLTIQPTVESINLNLGNGSDTVTLGNLSAAGLTELRFNGQNGDDRIDFSGATLLGNVVLIADGGAGNDIILGSTGNDYLIGGEGDDSISGGDGNDRIEGGNGADLLNGQGGDDQLFGEAGNDVITGGDGDDVASGGLDNDAIDGGNGNDTLRGNFGDDLVVGSFGDDSIDGGLGRDTVVGGAGNDRLDGGHNDDTVLGNGGDDLLFGNDGNDFANGGSGNDTINGGDGNDILIGGDGDDLIGGFDGSDLLSGDGGNDTLAGGDADDTLLGGDGDDVLLGEQGADSLNGNAGSNIGNVGEGTDVSAVSVSLDNSLVLSQSLLDALNGL